MVSGMAARRAEGVPLVMKSEEFRRFGHEVVEWIAEYLETNRALPVLPDVKPGELIDRLRGQCAADDSVNEIPPRVS